MYIYINEIYIYIYIYMTLTDLNILIKIVNFWKNYVNKLIIYGENNSRLPM